MKDRETKRKGFLAAGVLVALGSLLLFVLGEKHRWISLLRLGYPASKLLRILAGCLLLGVGLLLLLVSNRRKPEQKQEGSKTKVQPCNGPLMAFFYTLFRFYYFLCGVRIHATNRCQTPIQGPCIVLCNHGSFLDFVYAAILLRKCKPHFVTARLYFYHNLLGTLLRKLGCFPKSMFALDIESTRNSVQVLRQGGVLAMMPEARLSTVGRFEDIQENTYGFLKKSAVAVYTVKLFGDYLAKPKWGSGIRRGARVEAVLEPLFTQEQIQTMGEDQIRQAVEQRLYYDEFAWLKDRPAVRYRCRHIAQGLENILSRCPRCHGQHTLRTQKNRIFCEVCGPLTALDQRYAFDPGFPFENLAQWYDWQKEYLWEQIKKDPQYQLRAEVELRLPGQGNALTRHSGHGVCTLSREGLTYTGTRDGAPYTVQFSLLRIYRLLFGAGENFEIYNGSEILYFVPAERRSAVDWYMASMLLNDEARKSLPLSQ